jgi:hypothetical protein
MDVTALYGETAFAAKGALVDRSLARKACERVLAVLSAVPAPELEEGVPQGRVPLFFGRAAQCAQREGLGVPTALTRTAVLSARALLASMPQTLGEVAFPATPWHRMVPWFEGVYELMQRLSPPPEWSTSLSKIADVLAARVTGENGFLVMPQTGADPAASWTNMAAMPVPAAPTMEPFVHFYAVNHFAVGATDAVLLGRMTGRSDMKAIAAGHLNWMHGLNPGVATSKVVLPGGVRPPWSAAAFIINGHGAFARGFDGFRVPGTLAKDWQWAWEGPDDPVSPRREAWWIRPVNNEFMTLVNGHTITDGVWDY